MTRMTAKNAFINSFVLVAAILYASNAMAKYPGATDYEGRAILPVTPWGGTSSSSGGFAAHVSVSTLGKPDTRNSVLTVMVVEICYETVPGDRTHPDRYRIVEKKDGRWFRVDIEPIPPNPQPGDVLIGKSELSDGKGYYTGDSKSSAMTEFNEADGSKLSVEANGDNKEGDKASGKISYAESSGRLNRVVDDVGDVPPC